MSELGRDQQRLGPHVSLGRRSFSQGVRSSDTLPPRAEGSLFVSGQVRDGSAARKTTPVSYAFQSEASLTLRPRATSVLGL